MPVSPPALPQGTPVPPQGPPATPGAQPVAATWTPAEAPPGSGTRREGLAVAAFVTGLCGAPLLSVIFGFVALRRIKRTGARGKGLAVSGLALSVGWVLIAGAVGAVVVSKVKDDLEARNGGQPLTDILPDPGECFDSPSGSPGDIRNRPCDRPHDAQMILTYDLPKSAWPGERTVSERSAEGCHERLGAWAKRRPIEQDVQPLVLRPTRVGWWTGDRSVSCAFQAVRGKLTKAIDMSAPAPGVRTWEELKAGDCLRFPHPKRTAHVTLVDCAEPHTAQMTHIFALPAGPWTGASAVEKKSVAGCTRRWDAHFRANPPKRRISRWYVDPDKEEWDEGVRTVFCYVVAPKGELTGTVM